MLENLDLPIPRLDALTTAELNTIQDNLAAADAKLKRQKEVFAALLLRRFETVARAAYVEAKKDTGTVRTAAPGSNLLELKIDVDKTVVWDQDALFKFLNSLTAEDAKHYGKMKLEVEEAKYKASPPAIQTALKKMRTVKAGKLKFTLVQREIPEEQTMQEAA